MKFVIVDGDREALEYTQQSLKRVYEKADIETFSAALSTYKYCISHSNEIEQILIFVVLKPIDGFKLQELICTFLISLGVVLTMREQSNDLIELIEADGNGGYTVKPVTPSKIKTSEYDGRTKRNVSLLAFLVQQSQKPTDTVPREYRNGQNCFSIA